MLFFCFFFFFIKKGPELIRVLQLNWLRFSRAVRFPHVLDGKERSKVTDGYAGRCHSAPTLPPLLRPPCLRGRRRLNPTSCGNLLFVCIQSIDSV